MTHCATPNTIRAQVTPVAIAACLAVALLIGCSSHASESLPLEAQGEIAFYSSRDGNWEIYRMQTDGGSLQRLTDHPARDALPRWSPDGTQIVFQSQREGNWDIYLMDANGAGVRRLTFDPGADESASWAPDGRSILFHSARDGDWDIYQLDIATGELTQLTDLPSDEFQAVWSPDGTRIAYTSERDGNLDIYVMDAESRREHRLTDHPGWDIFPAWSPDGRSLAFQSRRTGNWDIFRMPTTAPSDGEPYGNTQPIQLTVYPGADEFPSWSPDGAFIVYESDRGNEEVFLMCADGSCSIPLTAHRAADYGPNWRP